MKIVDKILKAPDESIRILIETPICNLKTIQRSAKNLKDPDPLSSMTAQINTKFPISYDVEKSKGLFPENLIAEEDTHQFGRRLCTLSAIDWWIDHHEWENEERKGETKKTIDVLYRSKRQEVETYYKYKWATGRIVMGAVFMQRKRMAMNKASIDLPREDRNAALLMCLAPIFTIKYKNINMEKVKALEDVRDLTLTAKISISSQLRLLLNEMDPKWRTVPVMPDRSDYENRFRHAFATTNFQVIVSITDEEVTHDLTQDYLIKIGKACWHILKAGKDKDQLISYLKNIEVENNSMLKAVSHFQQTENPYIKLILTLMSLETYNSCKRNNMSFVPEKSTITRRRTKTHKGVPFCLYEGVEVVNFESRGICGTFCHNADNIKSVGMVKCDMQTLAHITGEIAVYCRKGFFNSDATSSVKLRNSVYKKYKEEPGLVYECQTNDLFNWVTKGTKAGKLYQIKDIQPLNLSTEKGGVFIEGDSVLIRYESGQEVEIFSCEKPVLPLSLHKVLGPFESFLPPGEFLFRLIMRYTHPSNYPTLINKITSRDFEWGNASIKDQIHGSVKDRVIGTASEMLLGIDMHQTSKQFVAFLYCFSGQAKGGEPIVKFHWNDILIDFSLAPGGFYVINEGEEFINGKKMTDIGPRTGNDISTTLIPGFRIKVVKTSTAPLTTIYALQEANVKLGSVFQVPFEGKILEVTRDGTIEIEIENTLARHMISSVSSILDLARAQGLNIKRKTASDIPVLSKLMKKEELFDSDDDYSE
nr:MAG: polymerase PB2 [Xinjiang sediment orthomyxo-like virus 4]